MANTVEFLTVEEFKTGSGIQGMKLLENEEKKTIFLGIIGSEKTLRVQQDLDTSKDIMMRVETTEDGTPLWHEACMVNVESKIKTLKTF